MPPKRTRASSSNTRGSAQKRRTVNSARAPKLVKKTHPDGGFTIVALPHARIGDSETIDGVTFTVRNESQLRDLIRQKNWREVERTCTTKITNMRQLFFEETTFNGQIGHWDTSNVTDMSIMFVGARAFNQPIGGWNTSRVTDLRSMFARAHAFNQPIGDWNTSSVTDMGCMFSGAHAFNQPIGGWNTSSVTDMRCMFAEAHAFNQPIGHWDTSSVTVMYHMFSGARTFNQPIGGWNTSSVRKMYNMFSGAHAFNQPIGDWNTSRVTDMESMFAEAHAFNQPIGGWNTSCVTDLRSMFYNAWSFNQDLSPWARKLRPGVKKDDRTRRMIYGDPRVQAFRAKKYRLHHELDASDPVLLLSKVPLDDARVIAGDLVNGKIRHVFHKDTLDAMVRSRRTLQHPLRQRTLGSNNRFDKTAIVPLRHVIHPADVRVYKKLRGGQRIADVRAAKKKRQTSVRKR